MTTRSRKLDALASGSRRRRALFSCQPGAGQTSFLLVTQCVNAAVVFVAASMAAHQSWSTA